MREIETKIHAMHERWAKAIDNARYLGEEHRFKEKEYGLLWRRDYKKKLQEHTADLIEKFGDPCPARNIRPEDFKAESFNSEIIYFMIEKDYHDVMTFSSNKQLGPMTEMLENLEAYEATIAKLRSMLKEPELVKVLEKEQLKAGI